MVTNEQIFELARLAGVDGSPEALVCFASMLRKQHRDNTKSGLGAVLLLQKHLGILTDDGRKPISLSDYNLALCMVLADASQGLENVDGWYANV